LGEGKVYRELAEERSTEEKKERWVFKDEGKEGMEGHHPSRSRLVSPPQPKVMGTTGEHP